MLLRLESLARVLDRRTRLIVPCYFLRPTKVILLLERVDCDVVGGQNFGAADDALCRLLVCVPKLAFALTGQGKVHTCGLFSLLRLLEVAKQIYLVTLLGEETLDPLHAPEVMRLPPLQLHAKARALIIRQNLVSRIKRIT